MTDNTCKNYAGGTCAADNHCMLSESCTGDSGCANAGPYCFSGSDDSCTSEDDAAWPSSCARRTCFL